MKRLLILAAMSLLTFGAADAQTIKIDAMTITDASTFYAVFKAYDPATFAYVGETNPISFDKTTTTTPGGTVMSWSWAVTPSGSYIFGSVDVNDGASSSKGAPGGTCGSGLYDGASAYDPVGGAKDNCFTINNTGSGGTLGDIMLVHFDGGANPNLIITQ